LTYQQQINGWFLYLLGGIVALFVIVQSTVFLLRAWKQGKAIGMSSQKLWTVVKSSAAFSILPSIPIVISLFSMVKTLGVPVPWIRLSVVGSMSYELAAADQASKAMGMSGISDPGFNLGIFSGVVFTMSIGIIWGLVIALFGGIKAVNKGVDKLSGTDKKWGDIFVSSLFLGLVAAFMGTLISPPIVGMLKGVQTLSQGLTGILVLISSALIMMMFGLIMKKFESLKWLESFALPVTMIVSMVLAIFYSIALGGVV